MNNRVKKNEEVKKALAYTSELLEQDFSKIQITEEAKDNELNAFESWVKYDELLKRLDEI